MEKLILEIVVRSALLAICTAAALYILRVKAARVRHTVWTSVLALMLVLPGWTLWGPKAVLRVLQPAPAIVNTRPVVVQQIMTDADSPQAPAPTAQWTWQDSLLAFYLLGFCALMARLVTGTIRAAMLVRRAANESGRMTSNSCVAPITVGWLKPSVILPSSWTRWTRAQLHAVLAHENEHARRRDPLVQWLALFNRAVFWFHPLAWWLERRLSALSEEACDDAVLGRGHDPVEYSECLLGLARVVQESGSRVTALGMAMPGTFLPQRIRRIVEGQPPQRLSGPRMLAVGVACALVSVAFTAGSVGYAARPPAPQIAPAPPPIAFTPSPEAGPRAKAPVLLAQARPTPPAAPAPNTGQSLSGAVLDPSNSVVPGAPVTLTNIDTGASVSTTSDSLGVYRFDGIEAGTFKVVLRVPGFKGSTQNNVVVVPGEAHSAGRTYLQIGSLSESVSVVGSRSSVPPAPMVGSAGPMTTLNPPAITLDQASAESRFRFTVGRQAEQAVAGGPIRVGGNIQAASLTNVVKPVYPADLLTEGVQGTVKFEAVLATDGALSDIRVVPGNVDSRLIQPALNALKLWRYRPTLLNGEPVETLTVIDVNFSVSD